MSLGDFPEDLSQAMLVGMMLVGKSGVRAPAFYGDLREQTVLHESPQEACVFITGILRTSPETSENLRDNVL